MKPIFFAWTRSFWLATLVVLTMLFQGPVDILYSVGELLSIFLPWTGQTIGSKLETFAPIVLVFLAMQQRSGTARPYTLDPTATD